MPRLRGIMSNLTDRSGDVEPERFYVLRFYFGGGRDILVCLIVRRPPLSDPPRLRAQTALFGSDLLHAM